LIRSPIRILNAEPGRFSEHARRKLRQLGDVTEVEADREFLLEHGTEYDVWFICLRNVIDRNVLERTARLRYLVTPTTGTDHIDVDYARARGVSVLSLYGERDFLRGITATAELTWALLLALVRRVPAAHRRVVEGAWQRDVFRGTELREKTLGIVGYGRLGEIVAGYGLAFGMRVLAYDRTPEDSGKAVSFVGLDELLERADVVSVHLALTPDTAGYFNAARFARMKRGALFINTARGKIVDEHALLEALRRDHLGGAALDVLASETSERHDWLENDPLRAWAGSHDNLLLTPHIGGMTHESVERTNLFMIEKLGRALGEDT
jgi:D-3-phosphoglycerate dehydrogenase